MLPYLMHFVMGLDEQQYYLHRRLAEARLWATDGHRCLSFLARVAACLTDELSLLVFV